jgi:hypothetical protein
MDRKASKLISELEHMDGEQIDMPFVLFVYFRQVLGVKHINVVLRQKFCGAGESIVDLTC